MVTLVVYDEMKKEKLMKWMEKRESWRRKKTHHVNGFWKYNVSGTEKYEKMKKKPASEEMKINVCKQTIDIANNKKKRCSNT